MGAGWVKAPWLRELPGRSKGSANRQRRSGERGPLFIPPFRARHLDQASERTGQRKH